LSAPTPGAVNTGGGGGGVWNPAFASGAGGSGIVVIRYPNTFLDLTTIGGSLVYTLNNLGGFKIYTFTAGTGTVTV
jgi:hypothetical protein